MKMKPKALLELLGTEAVLLPIRKGTKAPYQKNWPSLTFDETQTPQHQASLDSASAIGVLLGSASGNLCSIDFDDDEALEEFLSLNSGLTDSLRTIGKRGANIWVKLADSYPSTFHFKLKGNAVGEWRSNPNQTVITGRHPDGGEYKIIVNKSPMMITYKEIKWGDFTDSQGCHIDSINITDNTETQITEITQKNKVEKIYTRPLAERIKDAERAYSELKNNPRLAKLYRTFIERKFTAKQGERNAQLVAMTTFLLRATSEETTASLVMFFYDLNQDLFSDSREIHEKEMRSHLAATRKTWLASLNKDEMKHFEELVEVSLNHTAAFRVCRELVDAEGLFFLSCAQLGERISIDRQTAYRILRQFVGLGIIGVTTKGTQHRTLEQDGKKVVEKGKATTYRWLLFTLPP